MITIIKVLQPINQAYDDDHNKKVAVELAGLSTDEKPLGYANGSLIKEMDTSKTYRFNAAASTWVETSESGGGGGEPAQYLKTITKDEDNKEITITDKTGTETKFQYGGGIDTKIVHLYTYTNGKKRLVGSEDLGEVN